ncbi:MAG: bifunctional UDP-sugar hydrolase/5'-nucleotidase [Anaerolineae bacterium]
MRALTAMGYGVLNAGSGELGSDWGVLRGLADGRAPVLVSSNGRPASVGQGSAESQAEAPEPYVIREVGGVRVGIVGVTSPNEASDASGAADITPAVSALRALLPEVRKQADVVVALADLEPAEVQELATAGLDLDVVLGSRVLQSQELAWVGQTAVVAVGGAGRYVGRLTLQVDSQGQVVSAEHDLKILAQSVADDPEMVTLLEEAEVIER